MSDSDKLISRLMYWLAEDLYRERPHRGGYAMENPPGNIRVEFVPLNERDVEVSARVNGKVAVATNPDEGWLDEVCP